MPHIKSPNTQTINILKDLVTKIIKKTKAMEIISLKEDLLEKMGKFKSMIQTPECFIDDYVSQIKNEVDLAAEEKLLENDPEVSQIVNDQRAVMIEKLNNVREELLGKMTIFNSSSIKGQLNELYVEIENSVKNQFICELADELVSLDEYEDRYVSLAIKIRDVLDRCEKELLSNQTLIFVRDKPNSSAFGCLIHLLDHFFSSFEADCIK